MLASQLVDYVYNRIMSNVVVSDFSLKSAIALLREGMSDGSFQAEDVDEFLGREFRYSLPDYVKALQKKGMSVANSLWLNDLYKLSSDYAACVKYKHGAECNSINVRDVNVYNVINSWCSEATDGRIEGIVTSSDIHDNLVLLILSTIYFGSSWVKNWDVCKGSFTDLGGGITENSMLSCCVEEYTENEHATAFVKNYRNGLSFVGILPKAHGDFSLDSLDIPSLLQSVTMDYEVFCVMPRLKLLVNVDLTTYLKFAGYHYVLSCCNGMFENGEPLNIDAVKQSVAFELDEYGTKAAAATSVSLVRCCSLDIRERRDVILDRPFAFMIYDFKNNVSLFSGKVVSI